MKVAVLSEAATDEAFTRALAEAVLGAPVEVAAHGFRAINLSYNGVRAAIPTVLRHVHFAEPDVAGVMVVVDGDASSVHSAGWRNPVPCAPDCRVCGVRAQALDVLGRVARTGRDQVRLAIGVAYPAIEAWYAFGTQDQITEAEWIIRVNEGRSNHIKQALKQATNRRHGPGIDKRVAASGDATRVAAFMESFRVAFPGGFGAFADDLYRW